jgi:uncharacterized protein YegP (UPF0339 family)
MARFVIEKTGQGKYHFVLKADNGEIIATSESYTTKASAESGVASVKANAASAPVEDKTGEN